MARVQLALNVSDLDEAISFYSTLFRTAPAKVRPGYANFAIDEPPLKLVLMQGAGVPGSINHLGIEVGSAEEVTEAARHLAGEGMATEVEEQTTCCFAVQDKVWVGGPDGARWEVYTVLSDVPAEDGLAGNGSCCAAVTEDADVAVPCC